MYVWAVVRLRAEGRTRLTDSRCRREVFGSLVFLVYALPSVGDGCGAGGRTALQGQLLSFQQLPFQPAFGLGRLF